MGEEKAKRPHVRATTPPASKRQRLRDFGKTSITTGPLEDTNGKLKMKIKHMTQKTKALIVQ